MPAHPHPAAAYRREYRRGDAEDQAWVVRRGAHVRTPGDPRLESHVMSAKRYVRGYGQVLERDVTAGDERFELVRLHRPRTRG